VLYTGRLLTLTAGSGSGESTIPVTINLRCSPVGGIALAIDMV
jgi:hypothetical protein